MSPDRDAEPANDGRTATNRLMQSSDEETPCPDEETAAELAVETTAGRAAEGETVVTDEAEVGREDDDLETQLGKAQAESAEHYDRYVRAVAELDNYRKRTIKMRAESREETIRDLLLQVAPLLDNMRRALSLEDSDAAAIVQGIGLIFNQFQDILKGYGLEEIDAVGTPFDPNLYEAMLEVESAEHPPGTVVEEMDKGYVLREKVVRPARVVVSKAPANGQDDESTESSSNEDEST